MFVGKKSDWQYLMPVPDGPIILNEIPSSRYIFKIFKYVLIFVVFIKLSAILSIEFISINLSDSNISIASRFLLKKQYFASFPL